MALTLRFHHIELAVCQLPDASAPVSQDWISSPFSAFLRVPGEATLICPADKRPENVRCETGWHVLELVGPFDFTQTGILAQITVPLAEAKIPLYAMSTFNTDYILIKANKCKAARGALIAAGHSFIE